MNRIAAIALLFLDEEDAFWCLVSIVTFLLPQNYYAGGMQDAHVDQVQMSNTWSKFIFLNVALNF